MGHWDIPSLLQDSLESERAANMPFSTSFIHASTENPVPKVTLSVSPYKKLVNSIFILNFKWHIVKGF